MWGTPGGATVRGEPTRQPWSERRRDAAPQAPEASPIAQDAPGGVVARRGHHPTARVGPGPAQVEAVDGRRVASEQGRRAHEGHLVEALLALEDRAVHQAEDSLQVG